MPRGTLNVSSTVQPRSIPCYLSCSAQPSRPCVAERISPSTEWSISTRGLVVTAAISALAGALIGVLGAFLIELSRSQTESLRYRRELLRATCADFSAAVTSMWNLAVQAKSKPADRALLASIHESHREARIQYERLRLTAASAATQEAARYVLRYAYGLVREIEGKPPRDDERERGPMMMLQHSLTSLVEKVRSETDAPNPRHVYREPDEWIDQDL